MLTRSLRQYLESLQRAGLSGLPRSSQSLEILPSPDLESSHSASETQAVPKPTPSSQENSSEPSVSVPARKASLFDEPDSPPALTGPDYPSQELSQEDRSTRLTILADQVSQCTRCPELVRTRKQTVFGVGNPEAEIMFIGEAPGAEEDEQGEPFVGKAGQLLNKIIEACQLKREEIYICNILRCRPPGNRNPKPEEASNCREFLDQQIAIVNPSYIVCWGSVAAQNLLGFQAPIGKMRQKWYRYGKAKVLCTYHPSYLLRNPAEKKKVWQDMKFFRADMGVVLE